MHQNASDCIRMLQNASEGFRMHQNASGRSRMLQIAFECFRKHQKPSECIRALQKFGSFFQFFQVHLGQCFFRIHMCFYNAILKKHSPNRPKETKKTKKTKKTIHPPGIAWRASQPPGREAGHTAHPGGASKPQPGGASHTPGGGQDSYASDCFRMLQNASEGFRMHQGSLSHSWRRAIQLSTPEVWIVFLVFVNFFGPFGVVFFWNSYMFLQYNSKNTLPKQT